MVIRALKITLFLLLLFIYGPLYSSTIYLKFSSTFKKVYPYSENFVSNAASLWPSSQKSFDKNVEILKHGETKAEFLGDKFNAGARQGEWNIFGDFGVGRGEAPGIVVGVIDTGVVPHKGLEGRVIDGADLISDVTNANDGGGRDMDADDPGDYLPEGQYCEGGNSGNAVSSWHGTHVAGLVTMNDDTVDMYGVANGALVLPIRALGSCGGSLRDVVDGILWSIGFEVEGLNINDTLPNILNLSLGGFGKCPKVFQEVLDLAYKKGVAVVVSSGNSGVDLSDVDVFPANCDGVLVVGATDELGRVTSYSNMDDAGVVLAPGGSYSRGVVSTVNSGLRMQEADTYAEMIGTSMAAPHVSGVIAVLTHENPDMTANDIQQYIQYLYGRRSEIIQLDEIRNFLFNKDDDVGRGLRELESSDGSSGGARGGSLKTNSAAGCGTISKDSHFVLMQSFIFNFFLFILSTHILKRLEELSPLLLKKH